MVIIRLGAEGTYFYSLVLTLHISHVILAKHSNYIPLDVSTNCLILNRIRDGSGKPVKIHPDKLQERIQINHIEQLTNSFCLYSCELHDSK